MAQLKNTNISDTGSLDLPVGTTAQRPGSPQQGMIRYNSTLGETEYYDGILWRSISDSNPEATGGTIVDTEIGGVAYRIHIFTNTGNTTFTVTKGGEVEYLVVAGGGGGGSRRGGGGGAGGLLQGTFSTTPQSYTVTVGAGGNGLVTNTSNGIVRQRSNGGNSSAFGVTAIGGGAGGHYDIANANSGGSGAGGSGSGRTAGASGTVGQGNSGGDGVSGEQIGAGGGGAGTPGENGIPGGTSGKPGDGGIGIVSAITGAAQFYAGGGAGGRGDGTSFTDNRQRGRGGLGGGGDGGNNSTIPDRGTPNTGGGGGAHGGSHGVVDASQFGISEGAQGENGGSGIVIIRYRRNASTTTSPTRNVISTLPNNFSIIQNGLVLHLDATDPVSYPGTGTVWQSLSSNDTGTLVNGVGYTSSNGGSLVFDGVNDYVNAGNLGSFYSQGTISYWMNSSAVENFRNPFSTHYLNSNVGIRFEQYSPPSPFGGFNLIIGNDAGSYGSYDYSPGATLTANAWYNVVLVWNTSTNNVVGHLNGVQKFNSTHTLWATTLPSISIGSGFNASRYFQGRISQTQIYNRALTAQEVQQNFNALRARYGI